MKKLQKLHLLQEVSKVIFMIELLFILSCNQKGIHIVKKEYYPDGIIKTAITYIDSLRDGKAISYYENGKIFQEQYYKNGTEDSIFKEYYSNGVLKKQGMYSYGTLMGSVYYYYLDGRIKGYNAKSYKGETFYSIFFDSLGNKTYEDGMSIAPVVADFSNKKIYKSNDTVHIVWCIAEPPDYKNEVQISIRKEQENNLKEDTEIKHFENNKFSRSIIDYKNSFKQPGNYQIVISSKLINTFTNSITKDTSIVDIIVQ